MSNSVFVTLPRPLGAERFDYVWAEHTLPRSVLEVPRDVAWEETVPLTVLVPGMILYRKKQRLLVYGGVLSRWHGCRAESWTVRGPVRPPSQHKLEYGAAHKREMHTGLNVKDTRIGISGHILIATPPKRGRKVHATSRKSHDLKLPSPIHL